jgi:hypothetical protein
MSEFSRLLQNPGVVVLLLTLILMIPLLLGNYLLASRELRLIAGRDDGLENFIWREEKIRKKGGTYLDLPAGRAFCCWGA